MFESIKCCYLGHFQLLSRVKRLLTSMAQKEVCPLDEMADLTGTKVFPIERHGLRWRFRVFSYTVRCAIVSVDIYLCATTFVQGGLLPAQVRGETLPFWSYLSAQVRQRESCRCYGQGNGEGVKMVPRHIPLSVR